MSDKFWRYSVKISTEVHVGLPIPYLIVRLHGSMHSLFYLVNLYKQNWYIFMVSVRNGTNNPSCTHITHYIQTLSCNNTSLINMGCTSTACTTWWYQLTKFSSVSWYVLQCANHTCLMQRFWCNDANTPTYCAIHIKDFLGNVSSQAPILPSVSSAHVSCLLCYCLE